MLASAPFAKHLDATRYAGPVAVAQWHAQPDADTAPVAHSYADTHTYAAPITNTDTHSYPNPNADTAPVAHGHAQPDANTERNRLGRGRVLFRRGLRDLSRRNLSLLAKSHITS